MSPDTGIITPTADIAAKMAAEELAYTPGVLGPDRAQRRANQRAHARAEAHRLAEATQAAQQRLDAMPLGTQLPTGEVIVSANVARVVKAGIRALERQAAKKERRRRRTAKTTKRRNR